jgi:hypothetical protein
MLHGIFIGIFPAGTYRVRSTAEVLREVLQGEALREGE